MDYGKMYSDLLSNYDTVLYAAFFDLLEDSMVDILFVTQNQNKLEINAIYNNIDRNSFFLKAKMISDSTVGTAITEASFKCIMTDLNDRKFIAVAASSG